MSRYYICIRGRKPGIFHTTWDKFNRLVNRYSGAMYTGKDTEFEASMYWTTFRHLVSNEYFKPNYKDLFPDIKVVNIKDFGKKKNIDKNIDDTVNEDEKNINFTFRNDNPGDVNLNNDESINNYGNNNNNPYNLFFSSRNTVISNDIDNNLPHFGGTNSMNTRIIINDRIKSNSDNNNNFLKNIPCLSCRNVIDQRLGPTNRSAKNNVSEDEGKLNVNNSLINQQINFPCNLISKHCDSICYEGYDPTMILNAMDAIVAKIKEMLK